MLTLRPRHPVTSVPPAQCASGERPHKAFSLPEILLILVAISLLAALLFPTLSRLRSLDANATNCQSNLMQIGQAITQYTQDNGGRFPIVASQKVDAARVNATGVGQVASQASHWGWIEAIAPYIHVSSPYTQLSQVFMCPSDLDRQRTGAGGSSYAMNRYLGWTPSLQPAIGVSGCAPADNDVQRCADLPYLVSAVTSPDQKVLVTEFGQVRNNGAQINSPFNQRGYYSMAPLRSVNFCNFASFDHLHNAQGPLLNVYANHNHSGNVLYVDGHVGAVPSLLDSNTQPGPFNDWIPLDNAIGGGRGWANHWYPVTTSADVGYENTVRTLMQNTLSALATQSSGTDTQYFANNVWNYPNRIAGDPSQLGPATEAATLWRASMPRNSQWYNWAVQSVDNWIDTQQNVTSTDPAVYGEMGRHGYPDTHFACNEIIATYLMLEPGLDQAHKDKWKLALTRAVTQLQNSGNMHNDAGTNIPWYANGNIELGESEVAYGTWLVTGDAKYKTLYDRQIAFTMNPPASRWPNFGLRYSVTPTQSNGSDGAGYLVESNGTAYGYDGDYTHFQLDIASRLYMMSKDPQVLRLANLFYGQLIPHVNQTTWVLDATNGSRHSLSFHFFTSGIGVLAWQGGRSDLAPKFISQFNTATSPDFTGNAVQNWGLPGLYRGYGSNVSVLMEATGALTPSMRTQP